MEKQELPKKDITTHKETASRDELFATLTPASDEEKRVGARAFSEIRKNLNPYRTEEWSGITRNPRY